MTPKEKEMLEAVLAYQRDVGKISKSVALAARSARKDLMSDAEKILETFRRKGGFATKAEAEAYLSQNITESERRVLIDRAKATYTGADLKRELTRLSSPAYRWRIDRKKAIGMTAKMCSDSLRDKIEGRIIDGVDAVVKEVSGRVNYSVQKQVGVALDWTIPNKGQLEAVHRSIGVYDKVKLWSAGELEDARTRISEGILNGHSYNDIARQVSKDSGKEAYKAKRLVRTTMAQASVDAEVKVLKDNSVDEYEIFCTLDERTCPICSKYDGKKYKMGKGPMPTFHPNCRCSITQVLPDEMKERARRAARDENGKTIQVPRNMTYDQWREKYGPKTSVPAPKTPKVSTETIKATVDVKTTRGAGVLRSQENPDLYPETVAGVKRGRPMTFEEADEGRSNKHFGESEAYEENCTAATFSNEMRRRGYDVTARALDKNDDEILEIQNNPARMWIDPNTDSISKPNSFKPRDSSDAYSILKGQIRKGERYSLWAMWNDRDYGHTLNAEIIDNNMVLFDPQSGTILDEEETIMWYLNRVRYGGDNDMKILRIDDKEPNMMYANIILEKR